MSKQNKEFTSVCYKIIFLQQCQPSYFLSCWRLLFYEW